MACPHQALISLDMPAVTNARVNGDSGMAVPDLIYSSALAAMVGLGWSKDNLWLTGHPQGIIEQQVIFAALSLGPAGLADRLEGFPNPPKLGEAVITNKTLAMSLCSSAGALLQPSFPLVAVDEQLSGLMEDANAFATYTVVGSHLSFIVTAFSGNSLPSEMPCWWTLRPRHLTDLIDCQHFPPTRFDDVPRGAYRDDAGDHHSCVCGVKAVAWSPGDDAGTSFNCGNNTGVALALQQAPSLVYISPISEGGVALLGEEGKVAMISTYRFKDIRWDGSMLHVDLRGTSGELVTLLTAHEASGFQVSRTKTVIGSSGFATVSIRS